MKRMWLILLLVIPIACNREEPEPVAPPVARVEKASVAVATMRLMTSEPRLSGTLQPQQTATILAETGGTVVSVSVAEGQRVTPGMALARISDQAAAESLRSAQVAVQSAETALAVARRDAERTSRLAAAGALATRDAEVARSQVATAESQLGLARSQLATARERVGNQNIVASTSGIVAEKNVSAGDVVQPGGALFTVVDLSTLQLEAAVSADALGQIEPGTPVDLEVRGHPGQTFRGSISRIAPNVDASTGQVRIYVSLNNEGRRLVGGLFAEGRVKSQSRQSLAIPIDALDESGSAPTVIRVRNGMTERVTVQLGIRNEAEGFVEIVGGLAAGDQVLVGPARTMTPGTRVQVT